MYTDSDTTVSWSDCKMCDSPLGEVCRYSSNNSRSDMDCPAGYYVSGSFSALIEVNGKVRTP